jgi:hypothetical protein
MVGHRPGVFRWLYYAYGGGLPARYAQWVLHDLTGRWWLLRHLCRSLVQCVPAFALLLLPGSASTLFLMMVIVVFGAMFMSLSYAHESRRHRLYKHGFLPDLVLGGHPPPEDD